MTSLENFRHSLNRYLQAPPLYVCKAIDKLTKNHRENDKESSSGIMPEIKDSDLCPVKSFISYFEKLNPNTEVSINISIWLVLVSCCGKEDKPQLDSNIIIIIIDKRRGQFTLSCQ